MRQKVLLLHGLAETSVMMMPMAAALRWAGFDPVLFDFPSTRHDVSTLTDHYLKQKIDELADEPILHIVGHSLGCVMTRHLLEKYHVPNLGRVVMLAPGNHGSPVITFYKHFPLYHYIYGPAAIQSAADDDSFADRLTEYPSAQIGIIAGCTALDPLSYLLMPWPHDGKTTVDGTKLKGVPHHITVAASHDAIMIDPIACHHTIDFLKNGRFNQISPDPVELLQRAV